MYRTAAFILLAAVLAPPAGAAPEFPVTLEGEYCGFGCVPVSATLSEDGVIATELLGDGRWRYSKRTNTLEVLLDDGTTWIAERDGSCFTGLVTGPVVPEDEMTMCAVL